MAAGKRLSLTRVLVWSGLLCVMGGAAIVAGNLVTTDFDDPEQAKSFLARTEVLEEFEADSGHCSSTGCPEKKSLKQGSPTSPESGTPVSLASAAVPSASGKSPVPCTGESSCGKDKSSDRKNAVVSEKGCCSRLAGAKLPKDPEKSAQEIVDELTLGKGAGEDLKPLVEELKGPSEAGVSIEEVISTSGRDAILESTPQANPNVPVNQPIEYLFKSEEELHVDQLHAAQRDRIEEIPFDGRRPAPTPVPLENHPRGDGPPMSVVSPKSHHLRRAADELDRAGLADRAAVLRKEADDIQAAFEAEEKRNRPVQVTGGQVQELLRTLAELREEVKQLKQTIEGMKQEVSTAIERKSSPPQPGVTNTSRVSAPEYPESPMPVVEENGFDSLPTR